MLRFFLLFGNVERLGIIFQAFLPHKRYLVLFLRTNFPPYKQPPLRLLRLHLYHCHRGFRPDISFKFHFSCLLPRLPAEPLEVLLGAKRRRNLFNEFAQQIFILILGNRLVISANVQAPRASEGLFGHLGRVGALLGLDPVFFYKINGIHLCILDTSFKRCVSFTHFIKKVNNFTTG